MSADPIAAQLRAARQRRGWSLEAFAQRSGIPAVVAGSWERGDRQPGIVRLRAWCEALDHDLVALGPQDDATGSTWRQYAVRYPRPDVEGGTDLMVCSNVEEAAAIAACVTGGQGVWRRVSTTDWKERP